MFVFGVLLFGVAVLALLTGALTKVPSVKRNAWLTFGGSLILSIAVIVASSITVVPTRNVGIVTAWNKPTGRTTGAGLQWTLPWESIDEWDASGQTYSHLGDECVW